MYEKFTIQSQLNVCKRQIVCITCMLFFILFIFPKVVVVVSTTKNVDLNIVYI